MQDVSDQVQRLANRATLIAIQGISGSATPAEFGDELKQLALDVREATNRTQRYAEDINDAVVVLIPMKASGVAGTLVSDVISTWKSARSPSV